MLRIVGILGLLSISLQIASADTVITTPDGDQVTLDYVADFALVSCSPCEGQLLFVQPLDLGQSTSFSQSATAVGLGGPLGSYQITTAYSVSATGGVGANGSLGVSETLIAGTTPYGDVSMDDIASVETIDSLVVNNPTLLDRKAMS